MAHTSCGRPTSDALGTVSCVSTQEVCSSAIHASRLGCLSYGDSPWRRCDGVLFMPLTHLLLFWRTQVMER